MRATVDTNVLIRAILDDHPTQSPKARDLLDKAELIAVTLPTLCELTWVLRKGYRRSKSELFLALETIMQIPTVSMDHAAVASGLALMAAGGDFADGVIAHEGKRLGGDVLVTFDRDAAALLKKAGVTTSLLQPSTSEP